MINLCHISAVASNVGLCLLALGFQFYCLSMHMGSLTWKMFSNQNDTLYSVTEDHILQVKLLFRYLKTEQYELSLNLSKCSFQLLVWMFQFQLCCNVNKTKALWCHSARSNLPFP